MPSWLKQLLSYVVSFVLYAYLLDWKISLLLVGGVSFHECGHLYAAKYLKMKTGGFYLIPFIGGVSLITQRYRTYAEKSFVLLAGPIAGGVLAMVMYVIFLMTHSPFIGSAAYWLFVMNLFNLIPLAMFDGGQLVEGVVNSFGSLASAIFTTGSYILAAILVLKLNPILFMVLVPVGAMMSLNAWKRYSIEKQGFGQFLPEQPKKMNTKTTTVVLGCYLLTALVLYLMIAVLQYSSVSTSDVFSS